MLLFETEHTSDAIVLRRTALGRLLAAVETFVKALALLTVLLGGMAAIEWLGRESVGVTTEHLVPTTIAGICAVLATPYSILRSLGYTEWFIRKTDRSLGRAQGFGLRRGAATVEWEVSLDQVRGIEVRRASIGRASSLQVRIEEEEVTIFRSHFGSASLESAYQLLRDRLPDVAEETPQTDGISE